MAMEVGGRSPPSLHLSISNNQAPSFAAPSSDPSSPSPSPLPLVVVSTFNHVHWSHHLQRFSLLISSSWILIYGSFPLSLFVFLWFTLNCLQLRWLGDQASHWLLRRCWLTHQRRWRSELRLSAPLCAAVMLPSGNPRSSTVFYVCPSSFLSLWFILGILSLCLIVNPVFFSKV